MTNHNTLILGASTGLGRSLAKLCWQKNWPTIEVSLESASSTADNRHVYQCDLAQPDSVNQLLNKLDQRSYKINRFFWVAGTLWRGRLTNQTPTDLQHIIDINLRNSILIAQWAWQQMRNNNTPSSYTVVSSASGVRTYQDFLKYTQQVSYVTTKYAQVGFTRSLAGENTNPDIKFSLILPDGMNTPMRKHFKPEENQNLLNPDQVAAFIFNKIINQTEPYFEEFIPKGSLDNFPMPAQPASHSHSPA